jgi:hypothetical protein
VIFLKSLRNASFNKDSGMSLISAGFISLDSTFNYEKLLEYFLDMVNLYEYLNLSKQNFYLAPFKIRFLCKLFIKV